MRAFKDVKSLDIFCAHRGWFLVVGHSDGLGQGGNGAGCPQLP